MYTAIQYGPNGVRRIVADATRLDHLIAQLHRLAPQATLVRMPASTEVALARRPVFGAMVEPGRIILLCEPSISD